jgi:hypothetical protein
MSGQSKFVIAFKLGKGNGELAGEDLIIQSLRLSI